MKNNTKLMDKFRAAINFHTWTVICNAPDHKDFDAMVKSIEELLHDGEADKWIFDIFTPEEVNAEIWRELEYQFDNRDDLDD